MPLNQITGKKVSILLLVLIMLATLFSSNPIVANAFSEEPIVISQPRAETLYRIRNKNSGKYLQITGTHAGANVVQASSSNSMNQRFKLLLNSDNYYNIISAANPNLRLDIANAANIDGANVQVYAQNNAYASAQKFGFFTAPSGQYYIRPKLSTTRALEVVNSSSSDGANVQIYTYKGLATQQWSLENAGVVADSGLSYMFRSPNMWDHISQNYNMDANHKGTDFDAPNGTPLYSVYSGSVIYAQYNDSMGYCAVIKTNKVHDGKNLTVRYLHMNQSASVSVNNSVTASSLVGYVGNTGNVIAGPGGNGTHLHFDVNNIGTMNGPSINESNSYDCRIFFPNINFRY